jgi:hypothetical protein
MKLKPGRPRFRIRFEVVRVRIEAVFVTAKVFLKSQNFWRFRGNGLAFTAAVLFVLDVMALVPENEIFFFLRKMIIQGKTSMD